MTLREATFDDLDGMKQLYVGTIQEVCKNDYSLKERTQWSSSVNKTERWIDVVETQYVLLAEIDQQIVGYGTLKDGNYIDFFYVHKDFQRQGIAQMLLNQLQCKAIELGSKSLTSDISITAKPFFEKNGFQIIVKQENMRGNEILVNYKMEKQL